jgi:hypothetical protein
MSKSRRDWSAISLVIGLLWLFPLFGLCVRLAYRGHEPEPLHALTVAYGMAVFFGAPVMALILTISIIYARNLGERVPMFAVLASVAAWILALIPWVITAGIALINHHH